MALLVIFYQSVFWWVGGSVDRWVGWSVSGWEVEWAVAKSETQSSFLNSQRE